MFDFGRFLNFQKKILAKVSELPQKGADRG
jgi:hypothetical protein